MIDQRITSDGPRWHEFLEQASEFICLDDALIELLAQYAPFLVQDAGSYVERFYEYLRSSHEISANFFERLDEARIRELISLQARHFGDLIMTWPDTAGHSLEEAGRAYDLDLHGVFPVWIAGAYTMYLDHLEARISSLPETVQTQLRSAVFRVFLADLILRLGSFKGLHNEIQDERAAISQVLIEITLELTDLPSPEDILERICAGLVNRSHHLPAAWFGLIEEAQTSIKPYGGSGETQLWAQLEIPYQPDDPLFQALHDDQTKIINNPQENLPKWCVLQSPVESIAVFPFGRAGGVRGVGVVYSDRKWYFDQIDLMPFDAFTHLGQLLLGLKDSHLRDSLSGLPNRNLFMDRLHLAMRHNRRHERLLGVGMMDLDGFKLVNDRLGHSSGDQLLCEVAERILKVLRQGDTVARFGGDEFGFLLPDLYTLNEMEGVVERILGVFGVPFYIQGKEVNISASIGLTLYDLDNADGQDLIRHADIALYQAKGAGRGVYRLFEHDREEHLNRIGCLQHRFSRALEEDELVINYQPKVNMTNGCICGVELLVRWRGDNELHMPSSFIEAVEQRAHLIRGLGCYVLEAAAKQIDYWLEAGHQWHIAVNIGARHLLDPAFLADVDEVLQRHPKATSWIQIEVTEQAALNDFGSTRQVLSACRERGLAVSLDDYGTGYASLTYLQELPADQIKLDRRFISQLLSEPKALAIIVGILTSARLLDLEVVAEGVESVEQGELLLQLGCRVAQGYLISRPLSAEALQSWAVDWRPPLAWSGRDKSVWFSQDDLPLLMARTAHRYSVKQMLEKLSVKRNPEQPILLVTDCMDEYSCSLGRWLVGAGRRHSRRVGFERLQKRHTELHSRAADTILAWQVSGEKGLLKAVEQFQQAAQTLDDALLFLIREIASGAEDPDILQQNKHARRQR